MRSTFCVSVCSCFPESYRGGGVDQVGSGPSCNSMAMSGDNKPLDWPEVVSGVVTSWSFARGRSGSANVGGLGDASAMTSDFQYLNARGETGGGRWELDSGP